MGLSHCESHSQRSCMLSCVLFCGRVQAVFNKWGDCRQWLHWRLALRWMMPFETMPCSRWPETLSWGL